MFNFLKSTPVLFFSALLVPLAASQGVAAPPGFNITSFEINGSGCLPGSAHYVLSADRSSVTVSFSKYEAETGPGVLISHNRRNCGLKFGIRVPQGFSFGIETVDYRGYCELAAKVTASLQWLYHFQGQIQQATARSTIVGPVPGDICSYRDAFDLVSTVTAPCGATNFLNINGDIRVGGGGVGYFSFDDSDGSLKQRFNFQWRRC